MTDWWIKLDDSGTLRNWWRLWCGLREHTLSWRWRILRLCWRQVRSYDRWLLTAADVWIVGDSLWIACEKICDELLDGKHWLTEDEITWLHEQKEMLTARRQHRMST